MRDDIKTGISPIKAMQQATLREKEVLLLALNSPQPHAYIAANVIGSLNAADMHELIILGPKVASGDIDYHRPYLIDDNTKAMLATRVVDPEDVKRINWDNNFKNSILKFEKAGQLPEDYRAALDSKILEEVNMPPPPIRCGHIG